MSGAEPQWIEEDLVLALHDRLLSLHGGPPGLRDKALLQSALARAKQLFAYDRNADLIDLASVFTDGIVNNHPFVDGNKRTGFVVGVLFLELNGYRFNAPESAATAAVLALAAGDMDRTGYADFLRAHAVAE